MSNLLLSRVFRAVKGLNPLGATLLCVMILLAAPMQAETTVLPLDQWVNADIGTTPVAGSGAYNAADGTYAVSGSGADIWGTADNFHYSYQTLSGDGVVVVRVQSVVNTNVWAKAGIMVRESVQPGSKYAMMMVTPSSGCGLQYRTITGGTTANVMTAAITAPRWLKLERRGNLISGYQSVDGVNWTLVRCVNLSLPSDVLVGFAACSRVTTKTLTTAVMDQVQLMPSSAAVALPWPWTETAIGQSTDQGVALFDGSFVLANLGADITSTADRCKFVNRTLVGDGSLVVKVASNGSADSLSRFGLMMRESFDANAKNVLLSLTTGNSLVFQSRQTIGGTTASRAASVAKAPPVWIKLTRTGNSFTASYSDDGTTWTVQGNETIAMGASIQVGLAYSNRSTSIWAFGAGDQLKLVTPLDADGNGLPDAWEKYYFGGLGGDPSADTDGDGLTHAQEWQLGTNPLVVTLPGQQPVVELVAGNNQTGSTGGVLPQPLVVKVTDAATGAPLPGVLVAFQVTSGQGFFGSGSDWTPSISLVSDANGLVQTGFKFSTFAGQTSVWVSAGTQPSGSVNFNLNAMLGVPGSVFQLDGGSIGVVSLPCQNQYQGGTYTLTAATGDIGSTADSLDYAWQSLPGDGVVVARVASLVAANAGAKAGLMIRESLDANARQVSIAVTPGSGVVFGWRDLTAGASGTATKAGLTAPKWLALRRSSGRIAGYYSDDGHNWTLLSSRVFAATQPVYVGLALSTKAATYSQATFDSVSVSDLAPAPWQVADIGTFNASNVDEFSADSMLIRAAGSDIGGTADSFRYLYQPLLADGSQVVRVASMANTHASAKSGVMIRESTATGSRYVLLAQTPGKGIYLQTRATTSLGASTVATLTGLVAPNWLKLERLGAVVNAYKSADGQNWTKIGQVNWGFGPSLIGLAASSINSTTSTTTVFDSLSTDLFPGQQGWSAAYFANASLSGVPSLLRRDATIDFNWPTGAAPAPSIPAATPFSVRWQGVVQPSAADTYTFTVLSNGGVRLWVDGQLLIDRWALQSSSTEASGQVALQAASQPKVVLDYFNGADAGRIQLSWSRAGQPPEVIPTGAVQPTDTDNDGIADTWELAHGLNAFDPSDASLVPDGDTLTNLAKFQLGLTPGQRSDRVSGGAIMEEWRNLTGGAVADLTNSPRFPGAPDSRTLLTSLETITNHADNYGERIRGYLVPPADGNYQFWIAADDRAELWLSSTDSPFDRIKIAAVLSSTALRAYDVKSTQKSAPITLQAGHYYYFEVLQKEATGADHLSVAWTRPGALREVIDGSYLATFAPRADNVSGDGLPDAWKTANGLDLTQGFGLNGAYGDPDGDGLSNLREYQAGTNPKNADSDQDGITDNLEILTGFNPLDASSRPSGATAPWTYADVGVVSSGGGTALTTKTGGYLLTDDGLGASGPAITTTPTTTATADAFRFLAQTVTGDFDLTMAVKETEWASGSFGIILRTGTGATDPMAYFELQSGGYYRFYSRALTAGKVVRYGKINGTGLPVSADGYWLRFRRQGKLISAYYSGDGVTWTYFTGVKQTLPQSVQLGFAVWNASKTTGMREITQLKIRHDTDSDGLFDDEEILLGTDPTKFDTDGDGLSDYVEAIDIGSEATTADVTPVELAAYPASSGVPSLGAWSVHGSDLYLDTPLGAIDYTINVGTAGMYRLNLDVSCRRNVTSSLYFPFEFSVDGQFVERVETPLITGAQGAVATTLPWLPAGQHTVRVLFDNTLTYRTIALKTLRLISLGGVDADQNGKPDWVDRRLAGCNRLFEPAPTSCVSPLCVEGLARYASKLSVRANGEVQAHQSGPNHGWYTNIPLQAGETTQIEATFENGAVRKQHSVIWTPLNLLASTPADPLTLRLNDRILVAAIPEDDANLGGSSQVKITQNGTTVLQQSLGSGQADALNYPFVSPGTYVISVEYFAGAYAQTGSMTVTVVETAFNGSPWIGLNYTYPWPNPQISTAVNVEPNAGLSFSSLTALDPLGFQFNTLSQNLLPKPVVARLRDSGAVAASTQINTLRVNSDSETSVDLVETYADGTKLIGTPFFVSALPAGLRVEVEIFVKGVTFQDGTTHRTLTPADFDAIGRVYLIFVYPPNLSTANCHRNHVYVGDAYLGTL